MTRVFLIRHGEAEGNIYRRAHGHYDGRITRKGLRQIDALAERFRGEQVDALYSSDLTRTRVTAGAITRYHDVELNLEPRLREINVGAWEDIPWGNITYREPENMAAFNDDPDNWHTPGCETFPQVRMRMRDIVCELAERHPDSTICCVSHGLAIRALISYLLGVDSGEIHNVPHGDNTSVSLLEYENGHLKVVYYNDASHLTEELSTFARQSWWRKKGAVDQGNLRFEPLDPMKEGELYTELYRKTWIAVHGTEEGFVPEVYLAAARRHSQHDENSILKAIKGDTVVGITELDPIRGESEGYGWISLCYVEPEERRMLLGVQLIGHAVSVFRRKGRKTLRLNVFEHNEGAIAFYREYGFEVIDRNTGVLGDLLLMEKDLT